jgi:cytochrome c oxidase assembly protein subunit 15
MGGLVTTYGAGMAVPDWPNTFGYNLFLYPLESWLAVWDVFLEHSHRLIGAAVGLVTIALAVAIWLGDDRRRMKGLGVLALAGVVLQGTLGGLRVLGNEIFLAKVHGCTAPVFFALTTALVAFTSPAWRDCPRIETASAGRWLQKLALWVTLAIYVQIVLGANLRHQPPEATVGWFRLWVWLHLIVAGGVLLGAAVVWVVTKRLRTHARLVCRARLLAALVTVQILLGLATWVVRYGIPAWFADYVWELAYTVQANSPLQAVVVTAHVAVGSLALVTALSLRLWAVRTYPLLGSEEETRIPSAAR